MGISYVMDRHIKEERYMERVGQMLDFSLPPESMVKTVRNRLRMKVSLPPETMTMSRSVCYQELSGVWGPTVARVWLDIHGFSCH